MPVGWFFSSNDRIARIRALIGARHRVSLEDLGALQRDVTIPSAADLRDRIVERVAAPDALPARARVVLAALIDWDGVHGEDSASALALELVVHHLLHALHDGDGVAVYRASWDPWALLRRDLAEADRDANWFVLLGGQDGWLGSQNFVDQYPLWRRGAAIQVPLDPAAARRAFTRTTTLAPADRSSPLLAAE